MKGFFVAILLNLSIVMVFSQTAYTKISSEPSGASVYVNGSYIGCTPTTSYFYHGKTYYIQITKNNYHSESFNYRGGSGYIYKQLRTSSSQYRNQSTIIRPYNNNSYSNNQRIYIPTRKKKKKTLSEKLQSAGSKLLKETSEFLGNAKDKAVELTDNAVAKGNLPSFLMDSKKVPLEDAASTVYNLSDKPTKLIVTGRLDEYTNYNFERLVEALRKDKVRVYLDLSNLKISREFRETYGNINLKKCTGMIGIKLPDWVTSIGDSAFADCTNLAYIDIQPSVTSIGSGAFEFCSNLKEITIPRSVKSIGDYAFYNCGKITVSLYKSKTTLGEQVFNGCKVRLINLDPQNSSQTVVNNNHKPQDNNQVVVNNNYNQQNNNQLIVNNNYQSEEDNETTADDYESEEDNETTADDYESEEDNETTADDYESEEDNETTADDYESEEDNETTANNSDNSEDSDNNTPVKYYGTVLLENLDKIINQLPANNSIILTVAGILDENTVGNFDKLIEVLRRNDIWMILDLYNLRTSWNLREKYSHVDYFKNCTGLGGIKLPDWITSIDDYAFTNCTHLVNISISQGVTSIGANAFEFCSSLKNISIPDNVTSIGNYAFHDCSNLTTINYKGTEEQWNEISIGSNGNEYLTGATVNYTE